MESSIVFLSILLAGALAKKPVESCPKLRENGLCPEGFNLNEDGKTCSGLLQNFAIFARYVGRIGLTVINLTEANTQF